MATDVVALMDSPEDPEGLDRRLERRRHHRPRHRHESSRPSRQAVRLRRQHQRRRPHDDIDKRPGVQPVYREWPAASMRGCRRRRPSTRRSSTQISEMWATQPDYKAEQLATIKVPVTIADGEHDEAIRQEHNEEMAKAYPRRQARDPAGREPFRHAAESRAVQRGGAGVLEGVGAARRSGLTERFRPPVVRLCQTSLAPEVCSHLVQMAAPRRHAFAGDARDHV